MRRRILGNTLRPVRDRYKEREEVNYLAVLRGWGGVG